MTAFADPAYRASLSPAQYERERQAAADDNTLEIRNGHALRRVFSRFGPLIRVGETDAAFRDLDEARAFADSQAA